MNKRERVVAAIRGERVDCVPSGFSIHFPEGCKEGAGGCGRPPEILSGDGHGYHQNHE